MLGFVQNWFAPEANPIGIDFGTDCLRLAQVEAIAPSDFRLLWAGSADVPSHLRNDLAGRLRFLTQSLRELVADGRFRGRRAILTLPAAFMHVQHVRMPRLEEGARAKAISWEIRGKLPFDPSHALIRHLVAGEVYQDQESRDEVIVMAAKRELVEQLLSAASKARLEVIGMNVEPRAIVDCFCHVYRRKSDADVTNCFLDMGCSATRAIVARGSQILFARVIPIGAEQFTRAVAQAMNINVEEARLLRMKLCHVPAGLEQREKEPLGARANNELRLCDAEPASGGASVERTKVEEACREPVARFIEELSLCRRYHEANFPNRAIDRLIFVGGEARHRELCQQIARGIGLAAQVGDPLVRMGRISDISVESGLDRRLPQPSWAVAIGLSMGPAAVADPVVTQ